MTETVPPADDQYAAEQWTYGGLTIRGDGKKWAVWYAPDRKRICYAPDKGSRYVTGCLYEVLVCRQPKPDGEGVITWRRGTASFAGQHPDRDWRAQVEATAYASEREIAAGQLERRARRDPALAGLIAPIEKAAASMTYAQRDALIAMITRRVYRASLSRRAS